jgi:hypothetical protein
MTFKKGVSGNPSGGPKDKIFTDALRVALKRTDGPDKKTAIARIANKLVNEALNGSLAAIGMVMDRIEGKPIQQSDVNINDTRDSIEQFSDLELAAVLRGKLDEERAKMPITNKAGDTLN